MPQPSTKALKDYKAEHNPDEQKNKAMTYEEQELFDGFLANSQKYNRWQPLFAVMLWTGLRAGELTGLRWCDVDLDKEIIRVDHALACTGDDWLRQYRTIRLRHLPENLSPDFVTFS